MAEAQRTVNVTAELVDTEYGLWCMACMTSAAVRAWVMFVLGERSHLQERLWCRRCKSGAHVVNDRT